MGTQRFFSPTAESFGVSAQIGSGVVRGGPEVRFHQGSTRVPRRFHEVLRGLRGGASTEKSWGYDLSLFFNKPLVDSWQTYRNLERNLRGEYPPMNLPRIMRILPSSPTID